MTSPELRVFSFSVVRVSQHAMLLFDSSATNTVIKKSTNVLNVCFSLIKLHYNMLKVHKLNDLSFFFSQLREKNKLGGLLRRLKEMKAPNLSSITTPSR